MCLRPSRPLRPVQAPSQDLTEVGGRLRRYSHLWRSIADPDRGAGVVGGRFSPGLPARSASAPAESRRFSCAPGGRSYAPPRGVRGHDPGVHVQEDLGARARVRARGGALSGVLSRAQEEPRRVEGLSRRSPGECRTSVREVQDGRASHGKVATAAGRLADVNRHRGRLPTRADPSRRSEVVGT